MNAVQILDRILEPIAEAFSPEVARRMLALEADQATQDYIDSLAAKSTNGELTDTERAEYKEYVDAIDLISILQAKAQRVLNAQ